MTRRHALVISVFLALALVAGAFAALRTSGLGARASTVPAVEIAAKTRQLDRFERALRREAQSRPPALPPLVAGAKVPATPPAAVISRRAAASVHVDAHDGEEHEHEHDHEHADD
jgi:hypothetical protein